MLKYLAGYLGTGLAFAALDFVWLTQMGPRLYRPALDSVLADKPHLPTAAVFYLVYVLGILLLAVLPAVREGSWVRALTTGTILGAMAYATYDLTNQATLKVWSTSITLADIAWGSFVTAVAATAGYFAFRWIQR